MLVDELAFDEPKTRDMAAILKALACDGTTVLVTTDAHDTNVYKSARNIMGVNVSPVSDLNALSVLQPRKLLMTKAAIDAVKRRAAGKTAS